jgi:hypothetical protein
LVIRGMSGKGSFFEPAITSGGMPNQDKLNKVTKSANLSSLMDFLLY